jgi:hypothetical protein
LYVLAAISFVRKHRKGLMRVIRVVVLVALSVVGLSQTARAQAGAPEGWDVSVYPVFAWVPLGIDIGVEVPPSDDGGAGGSGEIIDSRFDGAFFGGVTATNGVWRLEGYGIWAAVGGDRPEQPFLEVDLDLIYLEGKVGRRFAPDLYITGGLRRLAFDYDITLAGLPRFSRKPGIWDPLVGIGWHRAGEKLEWHASFDGGGFGVGADVDLAAAFRVDWKPVRHFGVTAGYNVLYLKVSDTVLGREVTVEPTLHGPAVGIGLYF